MMWIIAGDLVEVPLGIVALQAIDHVAAILHALVIMLYRQLGRGDRNRRFQRTQIGVAQGNESAPQGAQPAEPCWEW